MKKAKDRISHFFVDESGDPIFYDANGKLIVGEVGCSKILILGFIMTTDQEAKRIRKELEILRKEILADPYLSSVPSVQKKTKDFFHATNDVPEIRERVYRLIKTFDFKSKFIVARKSEEIFIKKHQKSEDLFYNNLITELFVTELHLSKENKLYFSSKGSTTRQAPLQKAIQTAIFQFEAMTEEKIETTFFIQSQSPSGEPCLQVIDYMNWAVYKAFNRDLRYLNFVWDKVSCVFDMYDFTKKKTERSYGRHIKRNSDITKISLL